MGGLSLVTAPTREPIDFADVKTHLRVDISDDDTYIYGLIEAVRTHLENVLWSSLVTQTWDYALDAWPGNEIYLPRGPLQSVTSITYTDDDGNSDTVSSDDYVVDTYSKPGRIVLKASASWPSETLQAANGIVIRFVAGYGDGAANVPTAIKHAMKLLLSDYYENREHSIIVQGAVITSLPMGVQALLAPYDLHDYRISL